MIREGTPEHTDAQGRGGTRIQSVARACQLLLWLADKRYGATAKEVALAHRLTLPTTYHLLNTLVDQGLLAKDEERCFVLDVARRSLPKPICARPRCRRRC